MFASGSLGSRPAGECVSVTVVAPCTHTQLCGMCLICMVHGLYLNPVKRVNTDNVNRIHIYRVGASLYSRKYTYILNLQKIYEDESFIIIRKRFQIYHMCLSIKSTGKNKLYIYLNVCIYCTLCVHQLTASMINGSDIQHFSDNQYQCVLFHC